MCGTLGFSPVVIVPSRIADVTNVIGAWASYGLVSAAARVGVKECRNRVVALSMERQGPVARLTQQRPSGVSVRRALLWDEDLCGASASPAPG